MYGTLYKYTNFAKGWQRRYFVLDGTTLQYYLREPSGGQLKKSRGSLPIIGAHITPSDEDGLGFTVSAPNEVVYKLKAADARNRQRWVDCLRAASAGSELPVQNIDNTINISEIPKSNSRIHEQLINARDSITAARQYLAEIEDYCANEPINIENLKLLSYGRSAIKALELAVDSADRTLFFGSKIEQEKSISLDKDSISSSSSDEENEGDNEDSSLWQSVTDPSDSLIEEYSDDQRENIISIIQTVPFGGDLFNTVWPQWLSGSESGSMKLARVCLGCPETTDPVEFLKWFLSISNIEKILKNRIPTKSPESLTVKSNGTKVEINKQENKYECKIDNGMEIKFDVEFNSLYRGPGKPYEIQIQFSEIIVGIQKWSVVSSPIVKISHPLSSPTLKFDGKWFIKNTTLDTKCELEINFENGEIKKGNLVCDDQNYRIESENDILLMNNSPLRFKQHHPIYMLK